MPSIKIVKTLRECRMFSNMEDEMLEQLADIARPRQFGARETIFNDGDPCEGFFILTEGVVKIYKLSADGKEHVLHLVWPGESFAEAALFLGDAYPAYGESIRASKAYLFPKDPFLNLIRQQPEFALRLLGGMALWMRRLVSQVEVLALRDASARLAQYLTDNASDGYVALQAPKAVVASHLGITPETLSRLFFKFEGLGIIEVKGRGISIHQQDVLRDIASGEEEI